MDMMCHRPIEEQERTMLIVLSDKIESLRRTGGKDFVKRIEANRTPRESARSTIL